MALFQLTFLLIIHFELEQSRSSPCLDAAAAESATTATASAAESAGCHKFDPFDAPQSSAASSEKFDTFFASDSFDDPLFSFFREEDSFGHCSFDPRHEFDDQDDCKMLALRTVHSEGDLASLDHNPRSPMCNANQRSRSPSPSAFAGEAAPSSPMHQLSRPPMITAPTTSAPASASASASASSRRFSLHPASTSTPLLARILVPGRLSRESNDRAAASSVVSACSASNSVIEIVNQLSYAQNPPRRLALYNELAARFQQHQQISSPSSSSPSSSSPTIMVGTVSDSTLQQRLTWSRNSYPTPTQQLLLARNRVVGRRTSLKMTDLQRHYFEGQVNQGLKEQSPRLSEDGLGGTYILRRGARNNEEAPPVGIFKPTMQEAYCPENPRGNCGPLLAEHPLKPGLRVGTGALREVAAYALDSDSFAGVPFTAMASLAGDSRTFAFLDPERESRFFADFPAELSSVSNATAPQQQIGSFQQFVPSTCYSEEVGPSKFSTSNVHRIGVFDIRMVNTDRHGANMLAIAPSTSTSTSTSDGSSSSSRSSNDNSKWKLVPIDHGLVLPDWRHLDEAYFEWFSWPQAKQPFDDDSRHFIESLHVWDDALLLRGLGIETGSVISSIIAALWLQAGLRHDLNLYQLSQALQRPASSRGQARSQLQHAAFLAQRRASRLAGVPLEDTSADAATGRRTDQPPAKRYALFALLFFAELSRIIGCLAQATKL